MKFRPSALVQFLTIPALLAPALVLHAQEEAQAPSSPPPVYSSAELVERGKHPVVRFAVIHIHSFNMFKPYRVPSCRGYLYFSTESIRYEVIEPEQDKEHSFSFPRVELLKAGVNKRWVWTRNQASLTFRGKHATYSFAHTALDWKTELPYQELISAALNFDDQVRRIQSEATRLQAPPPQITLLEPAGAVNGATLEAEGPALRVRGLASQSSGVLSVRVNGAPATLKTLTPQDVEFELGGISLAPGPSPIVVSATTADKTQGFLMFKMTLPEVRLLEPASAALETSETALTVRGLALGFREVESAELSGVRASLRKRDDGNVEFIAKAIPLAPGVNRLEGAVVSTSGFRKSFRLEVKRLPPPGPLPLSLKEIETALRSGVPPARLAALVTRFGVEFSLSEDLAKQLRDAGADPALLAAIKGARK